MDIVFEEDLTSIIKIKKFINLLKSISYQKNNLPVNNYFNFAEKKGSLFN